MAIVNAEVTVKLDDMGKQFLSRIAAVGPLVRAAIDHVRFPTPETQAALTESVETYLKLMDDEEQEQP